MVLAGAAAVARRRCIGGDHGWGGGLLKVASLACAAERIAKDSIGARGAACEAAWAGPGAQCAVNHIGGAGEVTASAFVGAAAVARRRGVRGDGWGGGASTSQLKPQRSVPVQGGQARHHIHAIEGLGSWASVKHHTRGSGRDGAAVDGDGLHKKIAVSVAGKSIVVEHHFDFGSSRYAHRWEAVVLVTAGAHFGASHQGAVDAQFHLRAYVCSQRGPGPHRDAAALCHGQRG